MADSSNQWQVESTRPASSGDWDVASTRPAVPLPAEKPTLYPVVGLNNGEMTTTPPGQAMGIGGYARGVSGTLPGLIGDFIQGPQDLANLALKGVKKLTGKDFTFTPHSILPTSEDVENFLYGKPKDQAEADERMLGTLAGGLLIQPAKDAAVAAGRTLSPLAERTWHALFPARFHAGMSGKMEGIVHGALENEIHQSIGETARLQEQALAQSQEISSREGHLNAVRVAVENHTNNAAKAQAAVGVAQNEMDAAEALGKKVAANELAQPQMTNPDQFAAQLQGETWRQFQALTEKRQIESGFGNAVESAGDAPRVDATPILGMIDRLMGNEEEGIPNRLANPTLEAHLNFIKGKLGDGHISIPLADSLRKHIGLSIRGQESAIPGRLNSDAIHAMHEARNLLIKEASDAWTPYKDALIKYRELSRPLDIFRVGSASLAKVIEKDPFSLEFELHEAQVVGEIMRVARRGNPILERLIATQPRLRDDARMYFAWDLFGQDKPISAAYFARWLRLNEQPLKQAGLFDDFKTLQKARQTAETRLEAATGNLSQAKALAAAHQNTLEIARANEKYAKQALDDQMAGRQITEKQIQQYVEGHRELQRISAELRNDLSRGDPQKMYTHVYNLLNKFQKSGSIAGSDYEAALTTLNAARDQIKNTARYATHLRRIALGIIILGSTAIVRRNWYSVKNMLGL